MESQALATVLVIGGALGWSVRDVITKDMHSPSPWLSLAASSAGGLIINVTVMIFQQCAGFGCVGKLSVREELWLLARCVAALASITLNFVALKNMDLALSTMIHCSSPLFVVLLGRVLLGERIKLMAGVCIVIAIVGMLLDIQPWSQTSRVNCSLQGYAAAFGSAISAGASYTSLRALKRLSSTTTLLAMYTASLTVGFIMCFLEGIPRTQRRLLLHFVALSIVTYLSEASITKGYALATRGAGSVAVFKFLTPIFAIIFDSTIYNKLPNTSSLIGAFLVVSASVAMVMVQSRGKGNNCTKDLASCNDIDEPQGPNNAKPEVSSSNATDP